MPVHVVAQGECLSTIARRYGLPWQAIYDAPANSELKKKRPNPNVLAPGDVVDVPDRGPLKWASAKTETKNKFVVALPKVKLRMVLRSWKGEALADKKFVVTFGDRKIDGRTTGEGLVDVDLPATTSEARLQVWFEEDADDPDPNVDRVLAIGHLDPIDSASGLQARLHNLGYLCAVTGELDEATLDAVRAFRAKVGLPEVPLPADDDAEDDTDDDQADEAGDADDGDGDGSGAHAEEDDAATRRARRDDEEDPMDAYIVKLLDQPLRDALCEAHDGRS